MRTRVSSGGEESAAVAIMFSAALSLVSPTCLACSLPLLPGFDSGGFAAAPLFSSTSSRLSCVSRCRDLHHAYRGLQLSPAPLQHALGAKEHDVVGRKSGRWITLHLVRTPPNFAVEKS